MKIVDYRDGSKLLIKAGVIAAIIGKLLITDTSNIEYFLTNEGEVKEELQLPSSPVDAPIIEEETKIVVENIDKVDVPESDYDPTALRGLSKKDESIEYLLSRGITELHIDYEGNDLYEAFSVNGYDQTFLFAQHVANILNIRNYSGTKEQNEYILSTLKVYNVPVIEILPLVNAEDVVTPVEINSDGPLSFM